jgi:hypothetical protein
VTGRRAGLVGGGTIPVIVCVDVEPDVGDRPAPGRWPGASATHRWLDRRRADIESVTGRAPVVSWFLRMDPQIEDCYGAATHAVDAHESLISDVIDRDEPLGLHIHAWRRDAVLGWVDDYRDPAWVAHCIDSSFEAFERALGRPCRLTRMGQRWLDEAAAAHLAQRTDIDLTVEAAASPVADVHGRNVRGTSPDYRRVPRRPYRPSATDITHSGGDALDLVEIPLTASRRRLGFNLHHQGSRLRRHRGLRPLDLPVQLGRACPPDDPFGERMARAVGWRRHPYIALALRSDGITRPAQGPRLSQHLDALLQAPFADRLAFSAPGALVRP